MTSCVQVIASGVDAAEMERRAQHMREQREALIAKKKAARNEKVQVEEERMAKKMAADQEVLAESIERVERGKRLLGQTPGDDKHSDGPSAEEVGFYIVISCLFFCTSSLTFFVCSCLC